MGIPMDIEDLLADLKQAGGSAAEIAHKFILEIRDLDRERGANLARLPHLLDKLERHLEKTNFPHREETRVWLTDYRDEFNHWATVARQRFGSELADALQSLNITLQGQIPLLRAGLFAIELQADQNKVALWYGPQQERLGEAPMQAIEVCKRIERLRKGLGSSLDPHTFVGKLEEALRRIPPIQGQRGIPIGLVLPEVAFLVQSATFFSNPVRENYRSYSRADFSYDLFRCAEEVQFRKRFQLVVATRMHTARKTDYLWVPSDLSGRGSTYSHIIAEEVRP